MLRRIVINFASTLAITLTAILFLAMPAILRAQGDYLDTYRVKVKPEKAADFTALAKKWADANRRYNGDRWIALETVYGDTDVFVFTSTRASYADIDKANDAVMGAVSKAFGAQTDKLLQDFSSCLASSHTELRRRRWDLSRKAPADAAAYAKLIGEARYLRTTAVHIRPGHIADFEGILKDLKAAGESSPNTQPVFVSQAIEGSSGTVFYVTGLRSSLAGFDNNPSTGQILPDEDIEAYLHGNAEAVEVYDSAIFRIAPELSNAPDEIAAIAPDFWRPKPPPPAHAARAAKPKK